MRRLTIKEASTLAGRSSTWLRRYKCAWCGLDLLNSIRNGCGALYKCDPRAKNYAGVAPILGSKRRA
jgi:hypothetical protein